MKTKLVSFGKIFFAAFLASTLAFSLINLYSLTILHILNPYLIVVQLILIAAANFFIVLQTGRISYLYPPLVAILTIAFLLIAEPMSAFTKPIEYLYGLLAIIILSIPGYLIIIPLKIRNPKNLLVPHLQKILVIFVLLLLVGESLYSRYYLNLVQKNFRLSTYTKTPDQLIAPDFKFMWHNSYFVISFPDALGNNVFTNQNVDPIFFWKINNGRSIQLSTNLSAVEIRVPLRPSDIDNVSSFSKDYMSLNYVRNIYMAIVNSFGRNGFIKNGLNSVDIKELDNQNSSGDVYYTGFERTDSDTKCGVSYPYYSGTYGGSELYATIMLACSDSIKIDTVEQLPFLNDLNVESVGIRARIGNFALVNNGVVVKINGKWKMVIDSLQDYPNCDITTKYQIPKQIVDRCFDTKTNDQVEITTSAY